MPLLAIDRRSALLPVVACLSCSEGTAERWTDQLQADAPCWQVDLSDGLHEDSAHEVHAFFDCLNQRGELEDLDALDQAFDSTSREDRPLGAELGRGVNRAAEVDVDLLGMGGPLLKLLEEDELLPDWLHLLTELVHGQSWASMEVETPAHPSEGPIAPMLPVLQTLAETDLDGSVDTLGRLAPALHSSVTADAMCSVIALEGTEDSDLEQLSQDLIPDMGEALARAQDPENDHWTDGSGNSVRDLAEVLVRVPSSESEAPIQQMQPHLLAMLESTSLRYQLQGVFEELHQDNHLLPLPLQLQELATEDIEGGSLSAAEDSAWVALFRMLSRGNTEVSCSIDLWLIELEIELGNFSVAILRELAQRDPEDSSTGLSLLGSVLGTTLSEVALNAIASSGLCPTLDSQMVQDLEVIDRFHDEEVGDLLIVLLEVLSAFHDAGTDDDLIEELVGLFSIIHQQNIAEPSQEVLRDLGHTDFAVDLIQLSGLLLDSSELNTDECATDSEPLTLDEVWGSMAELLQATQDGEGLAGTQPVFEAVIAHEGTWLAMERVTPLLEDSEATVAHLPTLLAQTASTGEDQAILESLAALLSSTSTTTPLLRVFEHRDWTQALQSEEGPAGGPLAYLSELVRTGTLEELLIRINHLIELGRETLESSADQ